MATQKQIEANRRNAMKSTGPRSAEGKAVSRMNALKTGIDAKSVIIPGEDPAELEKLIAEYYESNAPVTAQERDLVDTLVACTWRLRRYRKTEAELWSRRYNRNESHPLSAVFTVTDIFTRLQRHLDSTDRAYHRALRDLERLQTQRQEAAEPLPAAASQPVTVTNDEPNPQIGFVPPPPASPTPVPSFTRSGVRYTDNWQLAKP